MRLTSSQARAVAARGNVIVVAGAGTGKTSTLVDRCIELLREGASLDRVLMVTFTDAAAAEMRHRLRARLQELADTSTETSARDRFEEQLALVESARISTLHSFCLELVRTHFHELGVDPQPGVLDEHQCRVLAEQVLDGLLEECYAGALPWQEAVRSLVAAYAPDRDALVREWVLQVHRYTQSLPEARGWLANQARAWGSDPAGPAEETTSSEWPTAIVTPPCAPWQMWLIEGFTEWRRRWLPWIQTHAGVKNIDDCLAALASAAGDVTRELVAEVAGAVAAAGEAAWPKGTAGRVRDPLKPFFDEARFLASVAGPGALEADWESVRGHMAALLALTAEFTARFTGAKRELGGVDFPDLEQLTLQLLRDGQGQPTAVAQSVQEQFDQVFVDEYQDINAAQDAILSAVSRTGAGANRFLVGDVKQSIYQFRLADPRIFRRYEQEWGASPVAGATDPSQPNQRISLTDNFRSRPSILEFVNRLFGSLMRESLGGVDYEPLQAGDGGQRAGLGDGPCVELHLIRKESGSQPSTVEDDQASPESLSAMEREARLVAGLLKDLKRSEFLVWDSTSQSQRVVKWKDMAVLLRSPGPRTEAFAQEFHRAGIPLAAARGGFLEAVEVSDLISLLKLLDNPLQDIPLLAVLRSPLVGLSLDELAALRVQSGLKPFWWALRRFVFEPSAGFDQPANRATDEALRGRLAAFLEQFEQWRELARQCGPALCLERVLTDTSYDVLLSVHERGAEQMANVNLLLDYARQFDPYQRQGLFRFLRYVESLETAGESLEPAPVTGRDAVQLMSIHRSKGLEFPVVVLAALGTRFNLRELNSVVLLDPQYGLAPKALTPSGAGRYPTLPFWLAGQRQRAQRLAEELRLLYVAATRARDRLILTGTLSGSDPGEETSPPADGVSDQQWLGARCPLDWLRAWLPGHRQVSEGSVADTGARELLTCKWWDAQDAVPVSPAENRPGAEGDQADRQPVDGALVDAVAQRLAWQYAHQSATTEPAKSSVSALRHRASELADEESVRRFGGPRWTGGGGRQPGRPSAAERGTLHHRFLQHLAFERAADVGALARQLKEFVGQGLFTQAEASLLDLEAMAAFWTSAVGARIRAVAGRVRRELPFTVRLADAEVRTLLGQEPDSSLEGEFVVVQGVVDLVVVLDDELWLLDFKTDAVRGEALNRRAKEYEPQLRLYAAALQRIFSRPVRHHWLHFLAAGQTVELG
jgi:ATP-dependent helicase/nuclease subunit A